MPPAAIAGVAAAGAIGSGIAGAVASNNASKRAAGIAQQGIDAFKNINLPNVSDMQVQLGNLQNQGQISPELQSAIAQKNTEFGNVADDPRLRQAQMDALSRLQTINGANGLDDTAKAQLAQIQSNELQQQKGQRDAILQNAAQRGISGSGLELAAQLSGDQSTANSRSLADAQVAANAQQRGLQALQMQSDLGGQVRQQDYGEAARQAEAQDAINQFNTKNQQTTADANIQARNAAQAQNLAERQRIADTNTATANYGQMYNKGLYQQNYDNQLNQARGVAGQTGIAANITQQGGQNLANIYGGLGQAALGAGASIYANQKKAQTT